MNPGEPEIEGIEIVADGNATIDVRLSLECAECGTVLKEATFNIEWSPSPEIADAIKKHAEDHPEHAEFSAEETDVSGTEGGTSRKHTFGVEIEFEAKCEGTDDSGAECSFSFIGHAEGEIPASDFEECV
jgi:hypothetical protein